MKQIIVSIVSVVVALFGATVGHTQDPPFVEYSVIPGDAEIQAVLVDLSQVRRQLAEELRADPM